MGARSYHDFALGLALLLIAAAIVGTTGVPRPVTYLMGISDLTYLVQGWVVGSEGFSGTHHPDRGGLGPHPRMDDLAGGGRLADARLGRQPRPLGGARWQAGISARDAARPSITSRFASPGR